MYGAEIVYSRGREGLQRRRRAGARDGRGRRVATTCPTSTGTRPTRCAHYNGTALEILEELDEVDRVRRRPRHRRHADGQRPPLQGGDSATRQDRRRRADAGRARPGAALARRRLHPADHRPVAARPQDLRRRTATRSSGRASCSTRRACSRGVSTGAIASIAARIAGELDEGNVVFVVVRRRLEVPQLRHLHEADRSARGRGCARLGVLLVVVGLRLDRQLVGQVVVERDVAHHHGRIDG